MILVTHFKIKETTKILKGIAIFDSRYYLVTDEKFRLKFEGSRRVFLDNKGNTFVNPDNEVCPLAPSGKAV